MTLKCEYCEKDAIQIWYGSGLVQKREGGMRPVLTPLCKDHAVPESFIASFIEIKKEKK